MKLTKTKLKEIIREEIQKLNEDANARVRREISSDWANDRYKKPAIVKKYNDKTITDVIAQGGGQWTWLSKNKSGYTLDYYEDESPAFWSITKDLWGNEIYSEKKPPSDSILKKYGF